MGGDRAGHCGRRHAARVQTLQEAGLLAACVDSGAGAGDGRALLCVVADGVLNLSVGTVSVDRWLFLAGGNDARRGRFEGVRRVLAGGL